MIKEFEFFHGVIFSRILHGVKKNLSIRPYPTPDNASYVINDNIGLYVKYSTKRLTPWRFSFQKRHQDEILEMKNKFGEVFLLLVCNKDGVVVLSFDELKCILDESHENVEWVSASRRRGEKYTVCGSNGKLKFKVGIKDFPGKILKCKKAHSRKIFTWT